MKNGVNITSSLSLKLAVSTHPVVTGACHLLLVRKLRTSFMDRLCVISGQAVQGGDARIVVLHPLTTLNPYTI